MAETKISERVKSINGTGRTPVSAKSILLSAATQVSAMTAMQLSTVRTVVPPVIVRMRLKVISLTGQTKVSISEIMLVTEEGEGSDRVPRATRLPQWFEIYNASLTEAVSINNWYLEVQNDDTPDFLTNLHGTLRLPNVIIQPNQTVLVVSSSGLHSQNFPEQRTINVFTNGTYRQILGLTRRGEPMLNPAGFYIELRDHKGNSVDEIGNLGVSRRTGVGRRDNFGEQWEMPSLHSEDGHRTSLIPYL